MTDYDGDDTPSHSLCATKPIEQESFTEQDLKTHLVSLNGTNWALKNFLKVRQEDGYTINPAQPLEPWKARDDSSYKNATYEVYEIPGGGEQQCMPEPKHTENGGDSQEVLSVGTIWDTLKEVNANGKAVGRIT